MTAQQQVATVNDPGALIESVIVKGDLERLSPEQRTQYYVRVCESVGLNPLTKPFEYIKLNGKLTLYAKKDATDQLRQIHNISVTDLTETERGDVYVVTAKVQNGDGRTDMAKGAVTIKGLIGDALANQVMKCETKAKRRATLSICGLGFLDETEIETLPDARSLGPQKRTMVEISANKKRREDECAAVQNDLSQIETLSELERYEKEHLTPAFMASFGNAQWALEEFLEQRRNELSEPVDDDGVIAEPHTKADFIRACHEAIDAFESAYDILVWWNSDAEKQARRNYALNRDEVSALMARVFERRASISAPEASPERLPGDPTSTTADTEKRAGDAPMPAESGIDASEAWRAEVLELLANAKTLRAVDTIVATRVEPESKTYFPGDVGDIERAIERARKRVSKGQ